jgi:hypothetical protein
MPCLLGPIPFGLCGILPTQEGESLESQQVSQGLIFRGRKLLRFSCSSEIFFVQTQASSLTSDVLRYNFISDLILDVNPSQSIIQHVPFQARDVGRLEHQILRVHDGFKVNHHSIEVAGLWDQGVQGSLAVQGVESSCLELLI